MSSIVLVNFGGPRSLDEIPAFLTELLTDSDVIRSRWPRFFEKWFFKRVALKRAVTIVPDYQLIGGKSPIFEDTEALAEELRARLKLPVITFHRYLSATHADFLERMKTSDSQQFIVLPLFPQFTYATTGSIARFFQRNLSAKIVKKMGWVRSYPAESNYIASMQNCIRDFLQEKNLQEKDTVLFFSAHGLPQKFVDEGDPYERECRESFEGIKKVFPDAPSVLAFQSKFGPGEWLRPYTIDLCHKPKEWAQGRSNVVIVPLSFTSDHIETLFEIEHQYVPVLRAQGLNVFRCPALNQRQDWKDALVQLLKEDLSPNGDLVRRR